MKLYCKNSHFSCFFPTRIAYKSAETPGEAESLKDNAKETSDADLDKAIQNYGQERENTLKQLTQMIQDLADPNNAQYQDYTEREKADLAARANAAMHEIKYQTPDHALMQAGIYTARFEEGPDNLDGKLVRQGFLTPEDVQAEQAKLNDILLKHSQNSASEVPAEAEATESQIGTEAVPLDQVPPALREQIINQISNLDKGIHFIPGKDGTTYEVIISSSPDRPTTVRKIEQTPFIANNDTNDTQTPNQPDNNDGLFSRY